MDPDTSLRRSRRLAAAVALALLSARAAQAQVPTPCAPGACGPTGPVAWVASPGAAQFTQTGTSLLNVKQFDPSVVLNWSSFNIGRDAKVVFDQPSSTAVALNRIFQADPSRIFGTLQANGRVYLLNQNGIVFGAGSTLDVGGLVASSLNLTPEALEKGLVRAIETGRPAFEPFLDASGRAVNAGAITIDNGAVIRSPEGQVIVVAPSIVNRGRIETPDGQAILAAGQRVFLAASTDPNVRGLLVEVGQGGTIDNGDGTRNTEGSLVGQILADRGNATLAARAINQSGLISASTSVRSNGTIRLQARDTTATTQLPSQLVAQRGGTLVLGAGSRTETGLDLASTDTAVDATTQGRSTVLLSGGTVTMRRDALVRATGGSVAVTAAVDQSLPIASCGQTADAGGFTMEGGARIDVSGATTNLGVDRNVLRVELRGNQLQDSPVQRDGSLRSEAVFVDVRRSGTRADGSAWIGSPIGDLSGDVAGIKRGIAERNLAGGTITVTSPGSVTIAKDASLDVSGGRIDWTAAYVSTTKVLGVDGRIYDIAEADRDRQYVGIVSSQTIQDKRWGTTRTYTLYNADPRGTYEQGYVEGRDAGSVSILAPKVLLAGSIAGRTTIGPLQRIAASSTASAATAFSTVPLGARLTLGNPASPTAPPNYVLGDVEFRAPAAGATAGSVLQLDPALLGKDRIARLSIAANGSITLGAGSSLAVPDGGEVRLTASRIDVRGDIVAPGGTIALAATRTVRDVDAPSALTVAPGVRLDTSETWINDALDALAGRPLRPLFLNGGTISLSAADGSVDVGRGALLDVSAGVQRRVDGRVVGGAGGAITVSVSSSSEAAKSSVRFAGDVRGYALTNGGSLSLAAEGICIGTAACASSSAALIAPLDVWGAQGFRTVSLSSVFGDLEIPEGTVRVRQSNYVIDAGAGAVTTGARMSGSGVAHVDVLRDDQRLASNLSLTAANAIRGSAAYSDLVLGAPASIVGDPGAQIRLSSNSRVFLLGDVTAPGGSVSVSLTNGLASPYRADQALWLGSQARIDVSGTVLRAPTSDGSLAGTVQSGGSITLAAQRGYLVTLQGSALVADGASGAVDVRDASGLYVRRTVESAGGAITVSGAEGMLLNGTLSARAGGATALGGSLSVVRGAPVLQVPDAPSARNDATITLTAASTPTVVAPGVGVPDALRGTASIGADVVRAGGFASLSLSARNAFGLGDADQLVVGLGRVLIAPDAALNLAGTLALDAPSLGMSGTGNAQLGATYLVMGSQDPFQQTSAAPAAGGGTLTLSAQLIDAVGHVSIGGVRTVDLQAAGDVRLRGVFDEASQEFVGALATAGDLKLRAQQLYPVTLTRYTLTMPGAITVDSFGGAPGAVYSAAGAVTLDAGSIRVAGRIVAPAGQISLKAPTIDVADGGVLTTSTNGMLLPFGTTQGGQSWAFTLPNGSTRIYGNDGVPLPDKRIAFDGSLIRVAAGSVVDVQGGGDLFGYEFIPGPNGSRDVLSSALSPNTFAIVPGASLRFAPVDPLERSANLRVGDSVYLSGGGGVAAGTYVLMPARYGLLPGAFLVTAASGYQDLPAGQTVPVLGGGTIVSGFRTYADAGTGGSRSSGFLVRPASVFLKDAEYDLTSANAFFGATGPGAGSSRTPLDGGSLTFSAGRTLSLGGSLRTSGATGGLAGGADIAASRLQVIANGGAARSGFVSITADSLNALGLDSLLLGGRRDASGRITTVATDVLVDTGATLRGPDVSLVGSRTVELASGAALRAEGTSSAATASRVDTGAALVRVSSGAITVERAVGAVTGAGSLVLNAGSTLASSGGVAIDVAGSARSDGTIAVRDGSLWLGAPRIGLGSGVSGYTGLLADASTLQQLGLRQLTIQARTSLDLLSPFSLSLDGLRLSAPLIASATPGAVSMTAKNLELAGGASQAGAVAGAGRLALVADRLTLSGGATTFAGLGALQLASAAPVVVSADARLQSSGDVAFTTPRLAPQAGQALSLVAAGALTVGAPAGAGALPATTAIDSAGGLLRLEGDTLRVGGDLRARGGTIELLARTGDLAVAGGTRLDVSGFKTTFDGVDVDVAGGAVALASNGGSVIVAPDAAIDVGATRGDLAGSLVASAPAGTVTLPAGAATAGAAGSAGRLAVDARTVDSDAVLALAARGFGGQVLVRQRGAGDLRIGAGRTLAAREVGLTADQGAIEVAGTIDARGGTGGRVRLAARDAIAVSGTIDARSDAGVSNDASVALISGDAVRIANGARIDVSGGVREADGRSGGTVTVRLPRAAVLDPVRLIVGAGTVAGRELDVEGAAAYDVPGGEIGFDQTDASDANPWFADASAFVDATRARQAALANAGATTVRVVPGIDVTTNGSLRLTSDWNLANWRFKDVAGVLTLRAGGDVRLLASLNDGFASTDTSSDGFSLGSSPTSWSYRIVAGAVPGADPLSVGAGAGSVRLGGPGAPVLVRTGTGSIDLAAAQDIVFGDASSAVYTAGTARPGETFALSELSDLPDQAYPFRGGDLTLAAGRDVLGLQGTQLYSDWLLKGQVSSDDAVRWSAVPSLFAQGVAAFGGGSVRVRAARDIVSLGASTPSTGVERGTAIAGGTLDVRAGRSIVDGEFYADGGTATILAGQRIASSVDAQGRAPLGAILAVGGDTRMRVGATRGVNVLTALNPTLAPQSRDGVLFSAIYFATYTGSTAVDVSSAGGDVQVFGDLAPGSALQRLKPTLPWGNATNQVPLRIAPPNLRAVAASGSIRVAGPGALWPAATGNLELFAQKDVAFESAREGTALNLIVSDAGALTIPTPARPTFDAQTFAPAFVSTGALASVFNAPKPVHAGATPDPLPVRVVAITGDVSMQLEATGTPAQLYSPKPVRIVAGRDVVNLGLVAQNLDAGDVSSVFAGRDFIYRLTRSASGAVETSTQQVAIAGPGRFEVSAGREVQLQASGGITTDGNLRNPALPAEGADVLVEAGVRSRAGAVQRVLDTFVVASSTYDRDLLDFVAEITGSRPTSKADALARLARLDASLQYAFAQRVAVRELRTGGRAAAAAGPENGDFTRAFRALETLYPGANPADGAANPYAGNIRLYFSRIYTLSGGSIDLMAPGGEVNVGLAAPPVAFGLAKPASQLGVVIRQSGDVNSVSYRDFQVNESRTFSADGGNILVWSTRGDIDAGRGAKTAISAPPPVVSIGSDGQVIVSFPAALTGSGIQTLATTVGRKPGDVDLFAPRGVVNAGDAGIVAGNLTIAATAVLGANNISVSGTAVGVPVDTGGLGASLAGASNAAAGASAGAEAAVNDSGSRQKDAPVADAALNWLDVFVVGLGEENCKPDDLECLRRQPRK